MCFFVKQKTAYELLSGLVGSGICIRARSSTRARTDQNPNSSSDIDGCGIIAERALSLSPLEPIRTLVITGKCVTGSHRIDPNSRGESAGQGVGQAEQGVA